MRIGIEGSKLLEPHLTGIEYSLLELLRHLVQHDDGHEYVLYFNFVRPEYAQRFDERVRPLLGERLRAQVCKLPSTVVWWARNWLRWPIDSSLGRCDLVYYHAFDMRPQWFGARVATMHDLMPITHAEYYPATDVAHFKRLVPAMAHRADRLIAVSEWTRDCLVEHFGIAADRISVVPHGVAPHFRPASAQARADCLRRHRLDQPYVLFVGTAEPRKNLLRLVDAMALLRQRRADTPLLAIAGKSAWGSAELRNHLHATGMAEHTRLLGFVDAADLPALYSGATTFVLPSIAEGFGMPLLEAMACGAPVVAANTTALPEVYGDAALGADPLDSEALADAVARVCDDATLRATLVERGLRRAAQFTWQASAHKARLAFEAAVA